MGAALVCAALLPAQSLRAQEPPPQEEEESPTPPAEVSPEIPILPPRAERFPPPDGAFVVLATELRAWQPEAAGLGRELGAALADGLMARGRYHVVELRDVPDASGRSATQSWREAATRDIGRIAVLGDRARARVAVVGWIEAGQGDVAVLRLRVIDLDFMEELPGVTVALPPGYFTVALAPEGPPSDLPEAQRPPREMLVPVSAPLPPLPPEWIDGVVVALDAALMPRYYQVQQERAAQTPRTIEEEAQGEVAPARDAIDQSLDAMLRRPDEPTSDAEAAADDARLSDVDSQERELLGMSTEEYLKYKERNWSEEEWLRRQRGRLGYIGGRLSMGSTSGEVAQLYDGVVLIGLAGTDVVEKYARLLPASGQGGTGMLGVTLGVSEDIEVEARAGLTWAHTVYRTQQAFENEYPCEPGPDCPKLEGVASPVWRFEALGRYYFRRLWDLHPYVGGGGNLLRYADMVRAYNAEAVTDFPTNLFDPLPPLWTVGLSFVGGVSWDLNRYTSLFAEVPTTLRIVSGEYPALHYYAVAPQVAEPAEPDGFPATWGVSFGLHVRYR